MPGPDRQYDPVANGALGAIRASDRTIRDAQQNLGLPELPAQAEMRRSFRDGIKQASSFSPFNVAAGEGAFSLPASGGSPEITPGGMDVPEPNDVLPFDAPALSELTPQAMIRRLQGSDIPTPPSNGNGNGNGNGNDNGNGVENGGGNGNSGTASRTTNQPVRGRGTTR